MCRGECLSLPACCPVRRIHRGFTLIEAVVAMSILAMTLAVVFQSFSWVLSRGGMQRQRERAWLVAQSLLSEVRATGPLQVGSSEGETPDGFSWQTAIEPYSQEVTAH